MKNTKITLPFFLGLLLVSGSISCSSKPVEKLNPEAATINVLNNVTVSELERLQKLGAGTCEMGSNGRTYKTNILSCENYLRNEAAKKNADYLVITSVEKKGRTTASVSGSFYKRKGS